MAKTYKMIFKIKSKLKDNKYHKNKKKKYKNNSKMRINKIK